MVPAPTCSGTNLTAPKKQLFNWRRVKAGLQNRRAGLRTRISNNTGCSLILRSKYKDVWEGTGFTLAPDATASVPWTPSKPYERLGVFVDVGGLYPLPLLIGQAMLARTQEISFLRSPSCKTFRISTVARQP